MEMTSHNLSFFVVTMNRNKKCSPSCERSGAAREAPYLEVTARRSSKLRGVLGRASALALWFAMLMIESALAAQQANFDLSTVEDPWALECEVSFTVSVKEVRSRFA